jgi:predicted MFS family arabinose efflux permease
MRALFDALRGGGPAAGGRDGERAILRLIRALLLFESTLWATVTPLLAHYEHVLHASKASVGLLVAAYPAGTIFGAPLAMWLASRGGVRRPTLIGLLLFGASVGPFGFLHNLIGLDALRVLQGAACGLVWGGGLTWAVAIAPRERRGATIGSVFGAATVGALLGPVIGTLATWAGTGPVFAVMAAVAFGLALFSARHGEPPRQARGRPAPLRRLPGQPLVRLGFWLILLEAGSIGAISTLIPLRLSELGGSSALIGATFLITALMGRVISTPLGRLVDRRGAKPVLLAGMCLAAVLAGALVLPHSPWLLALACVALLGGPLSVVMIPAMAMITDATDRAGVPLAIATLMLNLAWAFGELAGAPTGAGLSQIGGDALPFLGLAGLLLATLWPITRTRLPQPAGSGTPQTTGSAAPQPTGPGVAQTGSSVTSRATSAA